MLMEDVIIMAAAAPSHAYGRWASGTEQWTVDLPKVADTAPLLERVVLSLVLGAPIVTPMWPPIVTPMWPPVVTPMWPPIVTPMWPPIVTPGVPEAQSLPLLLRKQQLAHGSDHHHESTLSAQLLGPSRVSPHAHPRQLHIRHRAS